LIHRSPQASDLTLAIGSGLVVAAAVFIAWFLYKHQPRPIPGDLGFEQTVDAYRMHLQRGLELSSRYLWWYLMPLAPGLAVLFIGGQVQNANSFAPSIMAFGMVVLGGLLLLIQKSIRMKFQKRIDELAILEEK
jgi:hypothetical protein